MVHVILKERKKIHAHTGAKPHTHTHDKVERSRRTMSKRIK